MLSNDSSVDYNHSNFICVGQIIAAHGIKGEVKIKSYTAKPQDIFHYQNLSDITGITKYKLHKKSIKDTYVIAKIDGIDNRNQAELLVLTKIYLLNSTLPKINDENEFYYHELIGLDVLNMEQKLVAKIIAIYNFGSEDLLEIQYVNHETDIISFNKNNIQKIDLIKKYVIISFPEII